MPGAVEFSQVGLVYPTAEGAVEAVREVSFSVADGEFVALIGPSGCGKSSLLKLALGLEDSSTGAIRISGREVAGPRPDVGVVFQSPVLLPWRTVLANVLLPADILRLDRDAAEKTA